MPTLSRASRLLDRLSRQPQHSKGVGEQILFTKICMQDDLCNTNDLVYQGRELFMSKLEK